MQSTEYKVQSKIQKCGLLVWLAGLLLVIGTARAQEVVAPVVLAIQGDLWTWTESTGMLQEAYPHWAVRDLTVSTDGERIAYRDYAGFVQQYLQSTKPLNSSSFPNDIFVLDTAAGRETQLTQQSPDARYVDGVPVSADLRSAPAWSPDGRQLAWMNLHYPDGEFLELWIHDFVSGTERHTPIDWEAINGLNELPDIHWAENGIVLHHVVTARDDPAKGSENFLVYDPQKGEIRHHFVIPYNVDKRIYESLLVETDGKPYIDMWWYSTGEWELIDLTTGESQPAPGVPEVNNPSLPDESYSMTVELTPSLSNRGQIFSPHKGEPVETVDLPLQPIGAVHPSPDGKAFAFIEGFSDGGLIYVTVWQDGERQYIVIPEEQRLTEFVWGSSAWRVHLVV